MTRPGGNNGGKGGRNYRLNWIRIGDVSTFAGWSVEPIQWDTERRWIVRRNGGEPVRVGDAFNGRPVRLKSQAHAERWVERKLRGNKGKG